MAELQGLQLKIDDFKRYDAAVLAVVVDPVEKNAEVVQHLGLSYPILSDPELRTIDAYDLRHDDGERSIARSATFVLDKEGVVRWRDLTDNFRKRPPAEVVVAAVASLH
jgi:peroxiredoxin